MLANVALSPTHLSTLAHCLSLEADLMLEDGDTITAGLLRDRADLLRGMLRCLEDHH